MRISAHSEKARHRIFPLDGVAQKRIEVTSSWRSRATPAAIGADELSSRISDLPSASVTERFLGIDSSLAWLAGADGSFMIQGSIISTTLIDLVNLVPRPQNPRISPRDEIINQIAEQIKSRGDFDPAHAIMVRPVSDKFDTPLKQHGERYV